MKTVMQLRHESERVIKLWQRLPFWIQIRAFERIPEKYHGLFLTRATRPRCEGFEGQPCEFSDNRVQPVPLRRGRRQCLFCNPDRLANYMISSQNRRALKAKLLRLDPRRRAIVVRRLPPLWAVNWKDLKRRDEQPQEEIGATATEIEVSEVAASEENEEDAAGATDGGGQPRLPVVPYAEVSERLRRFGRQVFTDVT